MVLSVDFEMRLLLMLTRIYMITLASNIAQLF